MEEFGQIDTVTGKKFRFYPHEIAIMATRQFIRMSRVKQTANAVDFTGGNQTRDGHMKNASQLAGMNAVNLILNSPDIEFPANFEILARMCALLHDIAHGPFSHAFDQAVYSQMYQHNDGTPMMDKGHDEHRHVIIRDPEMVQALEQARLTPDEVAEVWNSRPGDGWPYIVHLITQGPLGADRLDFVQRDARACGRPNIVYDPSKFAKNARIFMVDNAPTLAYHVSVGTAVQNFMKMRKEMYLKVYLSERATGWSCYIHQLLVGCAEYMPLVEWTHDTSKFALMSDEWLLIKAREHSALTILCDQVEGRFVPTLVHEEKIIGNQEMSPTAYEGFLVQSRRVTGYSTKELVSAGIWYFNDAGLVHPDSLTDLKTDDKPTMFMRWYNLQNARL